MNVKTHWNNQSASARQNSSGIFLEHVDVEHRNIDRVPVPMGPKPPIMEDLYYQLF
jgi:hypothetical protein